MKYAILILAMMMGLNGGNAIAHHNGDHGGPDFAPGAGTRHHECGELCGSGGSPEQTRGGASR